MKKVILSHGTEMAYEDRGTGEVVVLLHGFCGSSAYWQQVGPLLDNHYRLIMPDLRGHGLSSAPQGKYTMEAIAGDIAQLLERLEINQVHLFGHSLGGYVALAFAEAYPDKLLRFGLIHSTAYADADEAKANRDKAIDTIRTSGIDHFVHGLVPKLFAPKHLESMSEQVAEAQRIGGGTSVDGAAQTAAGMRDRVDRRSVLEFAKVPVLLVAGSEDGIIPRDKVFSNQAPHILHVTLEGVGHMSLFEAPERLADTLDSFLSEG